MPTRLQAVSSLGAVPLLVRPGPLALAVQLLKVFARNHLDAQTFASPAKNSSQLAPD
jgi:hypothetical protein